jgi:hypothetical protein
MELYAGAGQCDISKGYQVGTVEVTYWENNVTVTYDLFEGYVMQEAHVYVGCDKYPTKNGRKTTVSPGKYTYDAGYLDKTNGLSVTFTDVKGDIYIIAHAVTCEIACECNTTQYGTITDEMYLGIDCASEESVDKGNKPKNKSGVTLKSAQLKVYPNPFNDKIYFEFMSKSDTHARLELFDATGKKLKLLFDKDIKAQTLNTVDYTPDNLSSQILFYRIIFDGEIINGKISYRK